jgi:hypothetical protein
MARTANTEDSTEESVDPTTGEPTTAPSKKQISAQVSEKFWSKVKDFSREQSYAVSTFLRWKVETALGKNPTTPVIDANNETFIIGTQIDEATNSAIDDYVKNHEGLNRAQFLRQVAADAVGYDLSQEPERVAPGEGMRKLVQKAKDADAVLQALYATDPAMVQRIAEAQGKTLADLGIVVKA